VAEPDLATAVGRLLDRLPTPALEELAESLEAGRDPHGLDSDELDMVTALTRELAGAGGAAYLRGAIAGYRHGLATQQIEVVWSGPASAQVPIRSTPQALAEVIATARRELLLMTYSAAPYEPITVALHAAQARGTAIDIVVETLAGAGSALAGREPATAFAGIPGVRLWHWPREHRPTDGAKMHAKLAVADRHTMLVSSINLTESGVEHSIEAGLIVRGGHAPRRVAEHVEQLRITGVLARL